MLRCFCPKLSTLLYTCVLYLRVSPCLAVVDIEDCQAESGLDQAESLIPDGGGSVLVGLGCLSWHHGVVRWM